jgi:hypothetical protein
MRRSAERAKARLHDSIFGFEAVAAPCDGIEVIAAAAGAPPDDELAIARGLRRQARRALEVVLPALSASSIAADDEARLFELAVAEVLRASVLVCAEQKRLKSARLREGRLFEQAAQLDVDRARLFDVLSGFELTEGRRLTWNELPIEAIGTLFETLNACRLGRETPEGPLVLVPDRTRKQSGAFYTPMALTRVVVELALVQSNAVERGAPRICDPAMGAGAFLIEAWRQLGADARASECLHGVDRSWLAVAVAEASLWLLLSDPDTSPRELGRNLRIGDSLAGFDWEREFADVFAEKRGFDVVVGNPPWVAFAGRAAQPLDRSLRQLYATRYAAWRGYPTLHGLFVERATQIAPRGVVALVVPSPIADLDGYRAVRRVATSQHRPREPLLEFGQDAFEAVTQPCFALVLDPAEGEPSDRSWKLMERQRSHCEAEAPRDAEVLELLREAPRLPPEIFREMGFQTSRAASQSLLLRSTDPDDTHDYPLLEGRDVAEFRQGMPRLFLCADPEALRRARCRVRALADYRSVSFVVRQTAAVPIAALHGGMPFRNTLLAGFDHAEYSAELMVGLLNSALYRALHLTARRDARQAAFPQVKIGHLRALPRPPRDHSQFERVSALAQRATSDGMSPTLRAELDSAVFDLFAVPEDHQNQVLGLLAARAPKLGHPASLPPVRRTASSLQEMKQRIFGE